MKSPKIGMTGQLPCVAAVVLRIMGGGPEYHVIVSMVTIGGNAKHGIIDHDTRLFGHCE